MLRYDQLTVHGDGVYQPYEKCGGTPYNDEYIIVYKGKCHHAVGPKYGGPKVYMNTPNDVLQGCMFNRTRLKPEDFVSETLLSYDDIKGKRGVWELWSFEDNKRLADSTLFVCDGTTAWHGRDWPNLGYCCGNVHNTYRYKLRPSLHPEMFEPARKGEAAPTKPEASTPTLPRLPIKPTRVLLCTTRGTTSQ